MKISEILKEHGVGIVNAQNSTKDVGPGTIRKNLKAFNLVEGPSLHSTVSAIVSDTGNSINMLYDAMESAAQKFVDNKGDTKGLAIVLGGFTSRWMDRFYFNRLQSELHDLIKFYPKSSSALKRQLMMGLDKYRAVRDVVPMALIQIGKAEKNADLVKAGMHWEARANQHAQFIDRLKASLEDSPVQTSSSKTKSPSAIGSQMSAVEALVADILRKLPSKVSGEVRNAIARSENKLVALQKELAKRGIDPNSLG